MLAPAPQRTHENQASREIRPEQRLGQGASDAHTIEDQESDLSVNITASAIELAVEPQFSTLPEVTLATALDSLLIGRLTISADTQGYSKQEYVESLTLTAQDLSEESFDSVFP